MSEGETGFVPQEATETKDVLKEYCFKTIERVRERYPDYSQVFDKFKKTGKLGLFQESMNEKGQHAGIMIFSMPYQLNYTLGYFESEGKKLKWKYKNLPRIYQSVSYSASSGKAAGIQLDHPPTDWHFEYNNKEQIAQAFDDMFKALDLLRLHEEF